MTSTVAERALMFPQKYILAAQEAQRATGLLSSVTLAQWALESGYGKFLSAPNNYFGVKWFHGSKYKSATKLTREYYKGHWVTVPAQFVAYDSVEEAFTHHAKLLTSFNGPYKMALPYLKDWRKFIHAIGPIYATDPAYADKLIDVVVLWQLWDFDAITPPPKVA